jgi:hypothetical protein
MKYINKNDLMMLSLIPVIIMSDWFFKTFYNLETFHFWHVVLISDGYGGYITLRLFTSYQKRLALKKGLSKELDEINRIGKQDKNDRPRWIK